MKQAPSYAVCYDISNDRERARIDKLLKGYGFRVQKSVFECRLTRSGRSALIDKLMRLQLKTGSVRLYRVYDGVPSVTIGPAEPSPDEAFVYVL